MKWKTCDIYFRKKAVKIKCQKKEKTTGDHGRSEEKKTSMVQNNQNHKPCSKQFNFILSDS